MTRAEGIALTEGLFAHADGDYSAALAKWRPLAERGLPAAQALLGHLHLNGEGVKRDRRKARACFLRAAAHGDETALRELRALAEQGAREDTRALADLALSGKSAEAQAALGEAHRARGAFVEAYAWFATAAAFGDRHAEAQRDALAKLLTAKQLDRAKIRAQSNIKTITADKRRPRSRSATGEKADGTAVLQ